MICTCICKDLAAGYSLYMAKDSIPQLSPVLKLILLPTPCCYGLDATQNFCKRNALTKINNQLIGFSVIKIHCLLESTSIINDAKINSILQYWGKFQALTKI